MTSRARDSQRPSTRLEQARRHLEAGEELRARLGREPTSEELVRHLHPGD